MQHPTKHLRPHLTKEDCNGFIPDWTIDENKIIRGNIYDMTDFVDQRVDKYCELPRIDKRRLPKAHTPFSDESNDPHCAGIKVNDPQANHDDTFEKVKKANEDLKSVIMKQNAQAASSTAQGAGDVACLVVAA